MGLNILSQWESEINKFNPSLRVLAHHGPSRTKGELCCGEFQGGTKHLTTDSDELKRYHVVLTTYDVLSSEYGVYQDPTGESTSKKKKGKDDTPSPIGGDSDSDGFGGSLKARKEALLKANAGSSRKPKEKGSALYGVDWLRVVVGPHFDMTFIKAPLILIRRGPEYQES